jgi:hypothetical protein
VGPACHPPGHLDATVLPTLVPSFTSMTWLLLISTCLVLLPAEPPGAVSALHRCRLSVEAKASCAAHAVLYCLRATCSAACRPLHRAAALSLTSLPRPTSCPMFGLDAQPQVPNVLDVVPCAQAAATLRRVRLIWDVVDSLTPVQGCPQALHCAPGPAHHLQRHY